MYHLVPQSYRIASLAVALVVLVACTSSAATQTTTQQPLDKVTVLTDFAFYGYAAPFLAGIDQGFFRDEKIDLTVQPGGGSADTASKVGAGAAQFGLADPFSTLIAIQQGAPLSIVALYWQKHVGGFCYVQGRREFKTLADFEGAKMGGVADDAYLRILQPLMRADHRNADSISYETMTIAAASASMLKGDVDSVSCGASTFSSRKLNAKSEAGVDLGIFLFADHGFDAVGHGIITQNDLVKDKPDLVQRFVNAFARSVVWSQLNVDKAIDAYMKVNQQQNREGEKANLEATIPFTLDKAYAGVNGQFYIPPEKMQKTIEAANSWYGLTLTDPDAVYTNKFVLALPDALRQGKLP